MAQVLTEQQTEELLKEIELTTGFRPPKEIELTTGFGPPQEITTGDFWIYMQEAKKKNKYRNL